MADEQTIRLRKELIGRQGEEKRLLVRIRAVRSRIVKIKDALARRATPKPGLWHPHAIRVPYSNSGSFLNCPPRAVLHTTEGFGLPRYVGSAPHITFDPKANKIYQHMPVNVSALALLHPSGTVDTNRAHAIQIELIGFAKDTETWPKEYYSRIAALARWVEASTGVHKACGVTFSTSRRSLSDKDWLSYNGYCGHQHVPNNDHWDPGAFRIKEIV